MDVVFRGFVHLFSGSRIVSSMKGGVGRQFYSLDRRQGVCLDIQPQTTVVGAERCDLGKWCHRVRVPTWCDLSKLCKPSDWQCRQPWFYQRLEAYGFFWLCEGA